MNPLPPSVEIPIIAGGINVGKKITGAATSTADFLSRLTSANTWLRVAEVLLGTLLIAVGIAKITNASELANKIAGAAGTAGKAAALA